MERICEVHSETGSTSVVRQAVYIVRNDFLDQSRLRNEFCTGYSGANSSNTSKPPKGIASFQPDGCSLQATGGHSKVEPEMVVRHELVTRLDVMLAT